MLNKVKLTRKTSIAIDKLHNIVTQMEYFYKNTPQWQEFVRDASYIEEHILDLSTDKKVDHAKFAKKFKQLFFKENRELKEVVAELEEKVKVEELENDREITESKEHE